MVDPEFPKPDIRFGMRALENGRRGQRSSRIWTQMSFSQSSKNPRLTPWPFPRTWPCRLRWKGRLLTRAALLASPDVQKTEPRAW